MKVIYSKPVNFILGFDQKKKVADVCEQYDMIADANELRFPYIAHMMWAMWATSMVKPRHILFGLSVVCGIFLIDGPEKGRW